MVQNFRTMKQSKKKTDSHSDDGSALSTGKFLPVEQPETIKGSYGKSVEKAALVISKLFAVAFIERALVRTRTAKKQHIYAESVPSISKQHHCRHLVSSADGMPAPNPAGRWRR